MATDATGTPTPLGIPTINPAVDAPSSNAENEMVAAIDTLLQARVTNPASVAAGEVPVWNGSTWVRSSTYGLLNAQVTQVVAHGTKTTTTSTSGTNFAGGADVLTSALSFTAIAGATYAFRIAASNWGTVSSGAGFLALNLDGTESGLIASLSTGQFPPLSTWTLFSPSAGAHSVNARLWSGVTGTVSVQGGDGVAGDLGPIVATIERIA